MAGDKLIALFSEVLNVPADILSDDSSPEEVPQWNSLAAMNLVSAIEDDFDVALSTREIIIMRTIGKAREVLRSKGVQGV